MFASDPVAQRQLILDAWEGAAAGWGKRADQVRELGMPVSAWMIEHLQLQPGQRVLELAAGPGDTGFLAAELIRPDGVLVCSDAAEAMLEIARGRARELGIENVEFARIELEWIDLPTASVDSVLCRWGYMLSVDPGTALGETRRVLRPGGRLALAVWDTPERNPWATIASRALVNRGYASPPDPQAPGMFALSAMERLRTLLESAGFVEVLIESVELLRSYASLDAYIDETLDLSRMFAQSFNGLSADQQAAARRELGTLAQQFTRHDGSLSLPGSSLLAGASA